MDADREFLLSGHVSPSPYPRSENQGWRYFLYTMGASCSSSL